MFEVEIDGKKLNAEVTFYTAYLYEAEFRADLIKDLYGEQDMSSPIEVEGEGEDEVLVKIDFTKINWLAMTKVLWAALKTADDSFPPYKAWMKKASGANLWLIQDQLASEVANCFFRA